VWLRSDADGVEWEVPASFDVTVEQTAVYGAWEIKRNWHGTTAAVAQVTMGLASELGQPPPKAMLR
jgi:hypothetical protein